MFWFVFTIIICSLIIASSFIVRKMGKNAGELNIVTETFSGKKQGAGARFCHISDIHIAMMPVRWGDVLQAVKEEKPEFILITGDLVNKPSDLEAAKQFVLTLSLGAGVPVIITLGNHDLEVANILPGGKQEFIDTFTALRGDVRVADDGYTVVGNVLVGGLNDLSCGSDAPEKLIRSWGETARGGGLYYVLATHNADILLSPGVFGAADEDRSPLCVLCGHTHGGQIRMVKNVEFNVLKKDQLPKKGIFYGRHNVKGYDVYITSGLGCAMFPLRSGTRPEVVVVNIPPMC